MSKGVFDRAKSNHKPDCQCVYCRAKKGETWNKDIKGYHTSWKGRKQSEETKKNMKKNHWSKTQPEKFNEFIKNNTPNNPTIYEDLFFEVIKNKTEVIQQKKVGTYCCDFYLPEFNLIVEIDGYTKKPERDEFIKSMGYNIVHFTNEDTLKFTKDVVLPPKPELSFCECNCGQKVNNNKVRFLPGHSRKAQETKPQTLCLCGCGEITLSGNKYIHMHYSKTEEEIKKLSEDIRKRNLIDNPAKKPEVKEKLRNYYLQRITLPDRPYRR